MMADSDSTAGKSPAFQFYPKDFISDSNVVCMSLQERGAYITLLCHCWLDGSIPSDPAWLARRCGTPLAAFKKLWPALERCFRPHPEYKDTLIHPRLEREREKQAQYRRRQSDRSAKRWKSRGNAVALQEHAHAAEPRQSRTDALQSSSPDSSQVRKERVPPPRARELSPGDAPDLSERAGRFLERYGELHAKYRHGAPYLGKVHLDFQEALQLVRVYDDERLDKLATVWLNADDEFAVNGTRTVSKFRSRAPWCDERLRERGM